MATLNPTGDYYFTYPNVTVTTGGTSVTVPWTPYVTNTNNIGQNLTVSGPASFKDDILLRGKSLSDTIEKIEERLAILHPNTELESRWEELRELRKRYKKLEKEIIEKEKMWDIIKK